MAITKQAFSIIAAATSVPAGTVKATPVTGSTINCTTQYGGELTYKITNGTAPTLPCSITFQVSSDGVSWTDYQTVTGFGGTNSGNQVSSGTIQLGRGVMYVNAIAYGNTVNAVTVEAALQAVTGV